LGNKKTKHKTVGGEGTDAWAGGSEKSAKPDAIRRCPREVEYFDQKARRPTDGRKASKDKEREEKSEEPGGPKKRCLRKKVPGRAVKTGLKITNENGY